jgi:hypothetical protein
LLLIISTLTCSLSLRPALANVEVGASSTDFSDQYTRLTKEILLNGIELERFSLKYRLESAKQPKYRRLRYFLAQEIGSGGGLAFEVTGVDQFRNGRRHPLQISLSALQNSLAAAEVGAIVAGTGSGLELTSNIVHSMKCKRDGYDSHSANKFVVAKFKQIDGMIAQREALVAAHPNHPAYERAVIEGKILQEMRGAFSNEFAHFYADTKGYLVFQNLFFFLNASYNTVGATAAGYAYRGVTQPKFNGTANILFIVEGSMAAVSPLLSAAAGAWVQKHALRQVQSELHTTSDFQFTDLNAQCQKLAEAAPTSEGALMPSMPATQRLGLYTQSDDLFRKQLENETKTTRHLEQVALQTSLLGPLIGGTLATQGILGTYGYYHYPVRILKQLNQVYYGTVSGTVGTSMAVVGNAAWLLSSYSYEHRLSKENRLPSQLIEARLEHLNDLEKTVRSL